MEGTHDLAEEFIKMSGSQVAGPSLIADARAGMGQSMAPVSAALLANSCGQRYLSTKLAWQLLDQAEPPRDRAGQESRQAAGPEPRRPAAAARDEPAAVEKWRHRTDGEEDWQLMPLNDEPRLPPPGPRRGQARQPTARFPRQFRLRPPPIASPVPVDGLEEIAQAAVRWAACWTRADAGSRSRNRSAGDGAGGEAGGQRSKTSGTPTCC